MNNLFLVAACALLVAFLSVGALRNSTAALKQESATTTKRESATTAAHVRDNAPENRDPRVKRDTLLAASDAPQAPAFGKGSWINSGALSVEKLRGRVVLLDFWTFGCYNCRNTLPTLKKFHAQYGKHALTVVGVHSPESDYEKSIENVRRETRSLGILYPVVSDNSYDTWRAYGIDAWPTVVILDKRGRIRYSHVGEGAYDEQERVIKTLLAE